MSSTLAFTLPSLCTTASTTYERDGRLGDERGLRAGGGHPRDGRAVATESDSVSCAVECAAGPGVDVEQLAGLAAARRQVRVRATRSKLDHVARRRRELVRRTGEVD